MKVYELLDKPEKWTKKAFAKTKNGTELNIPKDPNAVCWCLSGALDVCYTHGSLSYNDKYKQICNRTGYGAVCSWNDTPERTYEEVIALCKELDI